MSTLSPANVLLLLADLLVPARVGARRQPAARPLGEDELLAMSDHQLNDLGIGRSEIPYLLGGADPRLPR